MNNQGYYRNTRLSNNGHRRIKDRLDNLLYALWGEYTLVLLLVVLALVAHSFNMFHYPSPSRFDDEGIYTSQAWSVLREGQLAPYTYWYDHAPAGWIFAAGWMWLTGGPHAFGSAIDSGRVFMLILHLAMVPMLYFLSRKLGASISMAALGTILFSFSPLAITYQRIFLLDNIMMFWILLSLNLLLDGWGRLTRLILSGFAFGIAMLSKETAVFLLPAVLYLLYQQRWQHQGRFAGLAWLVPMGIVVSWYPLYALIKGELLPAGASALALLLPDSLSAAIVGEGQVSLTETLRWQGTRSGGGLLSGDSMFWEMVRGEWIPGDPVLFVLGVAAVLANLVLGLRSRNMLAAGLLGFMPLFYLARGGIVFDFYLIYAIPFFALNLAVLLTYLSENLPHKRFLPAGAALAAAALLVFYAGTGRSATVYQYKPDKPLRESVVWIKRNISPNSRMVIANDMWTDLREPGMGGPAFTAAHSHWKVATDPEVYSGVFHDGWQNIDYVVITPYSVEELEFMGNEMALTALENSTLLQRWGDDLDYVEVWKVNSSSATERDLLVDSHRFMKRQFSKGGAYYDGAGFVTSENQAYAMLRAVWLDDKTGFYLAWQWTERNLLKENGLLAWLWKDGEIVDAHSATDADVDAALALLFAGRRWEDPALVEAGTRLAQAVWEHTVVIVDGEPYLTAGEWAANEPILVLNPSYYSPYAYRVFNEVDPGRGWWELIETSYRVIFESADLHLGKEESAGLPPDWVGLDPNTGELVPVELPTVAGDTSVYGYEAARTYWRLALDYRYVEDGRAQTFLELAGFLADEVQSKGYVSAVYAKDGMVIEPDPSMVSMAGAMAALLQHSPELAQELYLKHIRLSLQRYPDRSVSWGNPADLYTQEWGWFATALYADALPNLWWYVPSN
jgi:endo-1,4-beta-D-glucanase Y